MLTDAEKKEVLDAVTSFQKTVLPVIHKAMLNPEIRRFAGEQAKLEHQVLEITETNDPSATRDEMQRHLDMSVSYSLFALSIEAVAKSVISQINDPERLKKTLERVKRMRERGS
jgi:plasmid replication initiation protein